ncbi:hypothetical protein B0H14DRAFT_2826317 [Mycena olivaceomarginata]|nr:hypothetical protein B0H14DRAFT_2826317 [Mycena olivaceomarginata]
MLTFADPDLALALAGYENYLAVLSAPPPPSSSQEADPVNSDRLMIVFSPPLSQRPQSLQKVTRTQIEEGMAREWKHTVGSGFEALLRELDAYECMEGTGVHLDLDFEERWAIYEAVQEIHAAGVSHNDVEVRNIVRNEDGELYPQTSWCSELRCLWDDLDLDDS